MRLRPPAAGPAIAIVLLLLPAVAGCGGSSPGTDDGAPDDFAITVRYADGTVAPPAHVQWQLSINETGQGVLEYTPDYPGDGVPTFTAQFDVDPGAIDDLYSALAERDLLRDLESDPDPPIGGATESATVTADGRTIEIPAFSGGSAPLAPLARQIHGLVPRQVWDDFAARRRAYVNERYDAAS